ncbi:MAG: SAM-dependent methyltransferase [Trebonia sp.]
MGICAGSEDGNSAAEAPALEIDITRPHSARIYDYYLGGCFR